MGSIERFIIEYIQREYTIPDDINIIEFNYVESGYVDSIGLIQFITVIEDEYNIVFSQEDLLNPNIKIVGKLAELIKAKMEDV